MPVTVSIVEDDRVQREKLAQLIDSEREFCCLGAYANGELALEQIPLRPPQVVLMDIGLPKLSGVTCVQQLKQRLPNLRIVMLTMFDTDEHFFFALKAGADGYLVKRSSEYAVVQAVTAVLNDVLPFSSELARRIGQFFRQERSHLPEAERITLRECEVIDLISKGFRTKKISDLLSISHYTVKDHLKSIYARLHVTNRAEAPAKWVMR